MVKLWVYLDIHCFISVLGGYQPIKKAQPETLTAQRKFQVPKNANSLNLSKEKRNLEQISRVVFASNELGGIQHFFYN